MQAAGAGASIPSTELGILYADCGGIGSHRGADAATWRSGYVTRTNTGRTAMATAFGEYFRELRAKLNMPLRQFCIAKES